MKAWEWIDRLKAKREWASDYRVASEIGVGRATVSKYRTVGGTFDEETALKVAELLGEHPAVVLLDQAAERARTDEAREALSVALERIRGKVEAVPPVAAAGGGRGRIDISFAASITPGGEPDAGPGAGARPEYTSYPPPAMSSAALSSEILLQLVARRAAQSSYTSQHSLA